MYIAFEQIIKIMINVLIQILTRNKQGKVISKTCNKSPRIAVKLPLVTKIFSVMHVLQIKLVYKYLLMYHVFQLGDMMLNIRSLSCRNEAKQQKNDNFGINYAQKLPFRSIFFN